jgi:hypothetical protein
MSKQQEMRIEKGESDRISKHTKEMIARLAVATRRVMGFSGENYERMEYLENDYYLKKKQPERQKKTANTGRKRSTGGPEEKKQSGITKQNGINSIFFSLSRNHFLITLAR